MSPSRPRYRKNPVERRQASVPVNRNCMCDRISFGRPEWSGHSSEVSSMNHPVELLATRVAYGASQLPRVAWYLGHGFAMRRISAEVRRREGESKRPRARTDAAVPDRRRLFADMGALLRRDLANVEAGIYPLPADHDGSWSTVLGRSKLFFDDLADIH